MLQTHIDGKKNFEDSLNRVSSTAEDANRKQARKYGETASAEEIRHGVEKLLRSAVISWQQNQDFRPI
ncbi:hypothetical protein AB0I53_48115 [Saccharopolyspora sp. NPDC050389]|uniref:hypothetical protein n=1 Tax=Saccharopolyspora sp. NPDC050389 TaxID=3155516 RepID=UPI0033E3AF96